MRSVRCRHPPGALASSAPVARSRRRAPKITTPKEAFGFNFGDDYLLANYKQIEAYWKKLDSESDRMVLQDIGKTAEGRTQLMAIVTSPENHRKLARYKDISRRLALAEGLTDAQARALAKEGKAVVWIDGGLHATETLGAQQLGADGLRDGQPQRRGDDAVPERLHHPLRARQSRRQRSRRRLVHAQPDPEQRIAGQPAAALPEVHRPRQQPRLLRVDAGRDREHQPRALSRVVPADSLQPSPERTGGHGRRGRRRCAIPTTTTSIRCSSSGCRRSARTCTRGWRPKGSRARRCASGGAYDGWWNGGIRNTGNFHNIIAILTEMIGSPTPMRMPLVPQRQIPNRDLPYPIAPQEWHFKQSIDYSMSFNRAVLDYASRNRENLLFNIYRWGSARSSAAAATTGRRRRRGSTPSPRRWAAGGRRRGGTPERRGGGVGRAAQAGAARSARVTSSRPTSATFRRRRSSSTRCARSNITVQRATREFQVERQDAIRPARSSCMTDQAFRPHVIDMFEPQDHPDVIRVSGRAADAAVRQRRLDARVPDGRAVRSHPRGRSPGRSRR